MAARPEATIRTAIAARQPDSTRASVRPDMTRIRQDRADRAELATVLRAQQRTHFTRQAGVGAVAEVAYY